MKSLFVLVVMKGRIATKMMIQRGNGAVFNGRNSRWNTLFALGVVVQIIVTHSEN